MKKFDLDQWRLETPQKGETDFLIDFPSKGHVFIEVRSEEPVRLYAVSLTGEMTFIDSGTAITHRGTYKSLKAMCIQAKKPFSYAARSGGRWFEIVDPTPVSVTARMSEADHIKNAVRDGVNEVLAQMKERGLLGADVEVDVDEFLDPLEHDHELFEDDEDFDPVFGNGHMEEVHILDDEEPPPPSPVTTSPPAPSPVPPSDGPGAATPQAPATPVPAASPPHSTST